LKNVEDIYSASKLDCINGAECVSSVFLDDFQDPGTAEPFEGLGVHVPGADLGSKKGKAHYLSNFHGKTFEVLLRRSNPKNGLYLTAFTHNMPNPA
jgi:hypothetical protein